MDSVSQNPYLSPVVDSISQKSLSFPSSGQRFSKSLSFPTSVQWVTNLINMDNPRKSLSFPMESLSFPREVLTNKGRLYTHVPLLRLIIGLVEWSCWPGPRPWLLWPQYIVDREGQPSYLTLFYSTGFLWWECQVLVIHLNSTQHKSLFLKQKTFQNLGRISNFICLQC